MQYSHFVFFHQQNFDVLHSLSMAEFFSFIGFRLFFLHNKIKLPKSSDKQP